MRWLQERKVSIWDEWADENGDLGPVYGKQWRDWETADGRHIDQIAELIETIKTNPGSRRMIVSRVEPGRAPRDGARAVPLPVPDAMSRMAGCRSSSTSARADIFLGVPFNIASYALLTHMLAQQCGLEAGDFVWTGGDCHLYSNHLEQAREQLGREPGPLPRLEILRKRAGDRRVRI